MDNDKRIDVAIVTWPNHPKRIAYFRRVADSLHNRLKATGYELRFVCSSESERDPAHSWHGAELSTECCRRGIALTYRDNGEASLGAGMNAALRLCTAPLILLVQDDWELQSDLDLKPAADFLLARPSVDVIRRRSTRLQMAGGAWTCAASGPLATTRICDDETSWTDSAGTSKAASTVAPREI